MSDIFWTLSVLVVGACAGWFVNDWWELRKASRVICSEGSATLMTPEEVAEAELPSEQPKEFPIAGKPRRVRWAVKRREIEAKHRTKRERLEEWG